ncbi:MAG: hypothetical protein COS95_03195 [Ignavibacteriales bacterium CG07_land_8_20_14_0_80_59_12]|nr:MAG: hypothetical protein COS95_03195 [Ignavibacteriales bacterium CG07_land_8_20_14_0_80_59_12]
MFRALNDMTNIDFINRQIDRLRKDGKLSTEYLNFYEDILKAQFTNLRRVSQKNINRQIQSFDVQQRLSEGRPILDFEQVKLNNDFLKGLFQDLLATMERYQGENKSDIINLKSARDKYHLDLEKLVLKVVSGDQEFFQTVSAELNVKKGFLLFLARMLANPLLESYAHGLQNKISDEQWLRGYCPICGNPPGMARLEQETGKRILWCSFCNSEWAFQRIHCPFCSNKDHNRLSYFFVEEESPYRVDVCENCKKYLKTIDERRLPEKREIQMRAEDLTTCELDIAAEKEGYQNGQWWL